MKSKENEILQKMLTIREVASILNIHSNTVRRWEKQGLLESYNIGPRRSVRFKQEDILDFLDRSNNAAKAVSDR